MKDVSDQRKREMSFLIYDVMQSEQYFLTNCPDVYSGTRFLDKAMLACSHVPKTIWYLLMVVGFFDPYLFAYFVANGTLINSLIIWALDSALPLSALSDYPACSMFRASHIDDNVSTVVFVSVFWLAVKYQKAKHLGPESSLLWTRDIALGLFAVAAVASSDLYLKMFNGYDILLGAGVGMAVGAALAWVLVRVIRPHLDNCLIKLACRITFKDNSQIAAFWPSDHTPQYVPVPTQFHRHSIRS